MDEKLHIVQHLYGEGEDRAAFRQMLEQDDALRQEYHDLSSVKFALDHRKRPRPDAAVIDAILAASQPENDVPVPAAPFRWAHDRVAQPRRSTRRRIIRMVSALVVVFVVGGLGFWQWLPTADEAVMGLASTDVPQHVTSEPPAVPDSVPVSRLPGLNQVGTLQSPARDVLAWDEAEDVLELHRQIEMLRARSQPQGWGDPAVPLEMLPTTRRSQGLQQTGSTKRRTGGQ